ncbi:Pentatricopeptide repeat-containing protein [Platanthera guangdongensis]|uniref:Pentatricopeptide repeat-containing protein n=1 Tax=Platanthera guangdongensis TaxID=2320717 RepID=A0ABR2LR55_9ASPA
MYANNLLIKRKTIGAHSPNHIHLNIKTYISSSNDTHVNFITILDYVGRYLTPAFPISLPALPSSRRQQQAVPPPALLPISRPRYFIRLPPPQQIRRLLLKIHRPASPLLPHLPLLPFLPPPLPIPFRMPMVPVELQANRLPHFLPRGAPSPSRCPDPNLSVVLHPSLPARPRFFYCDLIDAFSARRLKLSALRTYAMLKEIPFSGRRPYDTMVRGLCLMGMPADAEKFLHEMRLSGFTPSPFEFRLLFEAYGRSAEFGDMIRVLELMQENGISLDTICANIVLSCYGDAGEFSEMVSWIHKMRESDIEFSIRTHNSFLNSSPTLITLTNDVRFLPLSIDALVRQMEDESGYLDEPLLLGELTKLPLLDAIVEWSDSEVKLDLQGLHVTTACVILLQWMEAMGSRLARGMKEPLEFSIICGSGKHSRMRGEFPVKKLISVMMFQLKSPLKIDRKNIGKFVAKGKPVRDWLCQGVF